MLFRLRLFIDNWKMLVHLIFGTSRFGVNNQWWSPFDSMWNLPWYRRINPLQWYKKYLGMKFRIIGCYFHPEPNRIFPRYMRKHYPWRCKDEGVQ